MKRGRKVTRKCLVPTCKNTLHARRLGISFHELPKEDDIRQSWLQQIGPDAVPTTKSVICSEHFLKSDMCFLNRKKMLRYNAMPKLKLVKEEMNPEMQSNDIDLNFHAKTSNSENCAITSFDAFDGNSSTPSFPSPKTHKKDITRKTENAITALGEHLDSSRSEDEYDSFGKYIAFKLQNLSTGQRIYAKKIINDTIFEAEFGNLNRNCFLHVISDETITNPLDSDFKTATS